MLARVRGVPVDQIDDYFSHRHDDEVDRAVARRQTVHEDDLLLQSELGRQIVRLRQEKDNLLDTVWLATSPASIKSLWEKVGELLDDQPSPLQREALAIPTVGHD